MTGNRCLAITVHYDAELLVKRHVIKHIVLLVSQKNSVLWAVENYLCSRVYYITYNIGDIT